MNVFYRSVRCTRECELLVRFMHLNICASLASLIRFAHHDKRHFENTEKTFWLGKRTRTQEKRGKKGSRAIFASVDKDPCNLFVTLHT